MRDGFEPIVRVHARVVFDVAELVLDGSDQRLGLVGGELLRTRVLAEDPLEEPTRRRPVPTGRDEDVDHLTGRCCVVDRVARSMSFVAVGSDRSGEFVVAAAKVLHERVTSDHDARRPIGLQAAHRSEPSLQSSVVALDAVVRLPAAVVVGVREKVLDGTDQRLGLVGGDLLRAGMLTEDAMEEPASRGPVTAPRDEDVDHLTVLINRPIDVAPHAGDADVGLVDEPAATNGVSAWSGGVDQLGGEALDPPKDRHVIDLDAAFGEEFFDIAVGEPEPQVPTHRQQDDLGREPEAGERRTSHHDRPTTTPATRFHSVSLTRGRQQPPTQRSRHDRRCA